MSGDAGERLHNGYLRKNMGFIASTVKVRQIIPHLPCLTNHDREDIEAKRDSSGNYNAVQLLLDCLMRRQNWAEEFISALEACEHTTLAAEIRQQYHSLREGGQDPNPPAPAAHVVTAHVHPPPSANQSVSIPESQQAAAVPPPLAPPESAAQVSPPPAASDQPETPAQPETPPSLAAEASAEAVPSSEPAPQAPQSPPTQAVHPQATPPASPETPRQDLEEDSEVDLRVVSGDKGPVPNGGIDGDSEVSGVSSEETPDPEPPVEEAPGPEPPVKTPVEVHAVAATSQPHPVQTATPEVSPPQSPAPPQTDLDEADELPVEATEPGVDVTPDPEPPVEETPEPKATAEATPEPPVEDTPELKAPVEETPEPKAPVEDTPEPKAPVEDTPEPKAAVEDTPEPKSAVEDTPELKAPVEETPEPKAPVEETPEPKAAVEDTPEPKAPVEDTPELKAPVEDTPEPKAPVEDTPEPKAPVEDTPEPKAAVEETPEPKAPVEEPEPVEIHTVAATSQPHPVSSTPEVSPPQSPSPPQTDLDETDASTTCTTTTPEKCPVQDTAPPEDKVVPTVPEPEEHSIEAQVIQNCLPTTDTTGTTTLPADGQNASLSDEEDVHLSTFGGLLSNEEPYSGNTACLEFSKAAAEPTTQVSAPAVACSGALLVHEATPTAPSPPPCQENGVVEELLPHNEPEENQYESSCQSSQGDDGVVVVNVVHMSEPPSIQNQDGQTPSMLGNVSETQPVQNNNSEPEIEIESPSLGSVSPELSSHSCEENQGEKGMGNGASIRNGQATSALTMELKTAPELPATAVTVSFNAASNDNCHPSESGAAEVALELKPQDPMDKKPSGSTKSSRTKYFMTAAGVGACALLVAWKLKH